MHDATAPYEPSPGLWSAVGGVVCFVIGGWLLANTLEAPTLFRASGLTCIASGLYLLVSGGVARAPSWPVAPPTAASSAATRSTSTP